MAGVEPKPRELGPKALKPEELGQPEEPGAAALRPAVLGTEAPGL